VIRRAIVEEPAEGRGRHPARGSAANNHNILNFIVKITHTLWCVIWAALGVLCDFALANGLYRKYKFLKINCAQMYRVR
jgi:hypothetical protein